VAQEFALLPDMTRQSRSRKQQRSERDEQTYHQPLHNSELPKNIRAPSPIRFSPIELGAGSEVA
jgi:hypothetical protein